MDKIEQFLMNKIEEIDRTRKIRYVEARCDARA